MTSASRPDCPLLTDHTVTELARAGEIVLDSWHLYDGAGIAVDRHRSRFTAHVQEVFGVDKDETVAAYDHALAHLPSDGSWFPGFVWTSKGLRLVLRPFPVEHLRSSTTLLLQGTLDARKRPDIKGIDYLSQLYAHRQATDAGYDDQVLATGDGSLTETVFATLLIAQGGELIVPDAPRLAGITLEVLGERAGRPVRLDTVTPSRLLAAPAVFTLSSLHGVRVVERVNDASYQPNPALRDRLQEVLDEARGPVADLLGEGTQLPCASY